METTRENILTQGMNIARRNKTGIIVTATAVGAALTGWAAKRAIITLVNRRRLQAPLASQEPVTESVEQPKTPVELIDIELAGWSGLYVHHRPNKGMTEIGYRCRAGNAKADLSVYQVSVPMGDGLDDHLYRVRADLDNAQAVVEMIENLSGMKNREVIDVAGKLPE